VSQYWKDCMDNKVTAIQYIGGLCRYLLASPVNEFEKQHQIKIAFGNGLRMDIWEKFKERCEFYLFTLSHPRLLGSILDILESFMVLQKEMPQFLIHIIRVELLDMSLL
jgi:hypothetical protein